MADSASELVTWEEIELCESYLLCHMFEDAAVLAASILTRTVENQSLDDAMLQDMMESAAMVLVQSSTELGRTSELFNELKKYYGSTAAIPVEVVLTGSCVQVSNGLSSIAQEFLEDFLSKWQFENGKYIHVADSNMHVNYAKLGLNLVLEVDQYLKIVEFYVLTLLGTVLHNPGFATLWVEKAHIPDEARQDLIRRIESLCSLKSTSEAHKSALVDKEINALHGKKFDEPKETQIVQNGSYPDGLNIKKLQISKQHGYIKKYFYWLRDVIVNHGNSYSAASKMKMLVCCLFFILCYRLHKQRRALIRYAKNHLLSLKQGLVDLWQLAFSHQVNPLAAVQSLPISNQRS